MLFKSETDPKERTWEIIFEGGIEIAYRDGLLMILPCFLNQIAKVHANNVYIRKSWEYPKK